jgi:hypothetical protein
VRQGNGGHAAEGGFSVGIALAERDSGRNRPVIVVVGDGSVQYSVQSIWTATQLHLPVLIVILRNEEYCILKSFAVLEETPGAPGLDIPGIHIASIAKGSGAKASASTILTRSRKPLLRHGVRPSRPCWRFRSPLK